ncbi:MAG: GAF domain-containing SpoIIE family protein phosphatase [Gemmatimonadaceae bacterium]|nr:GAF domain-containing SpoIIE family protein phosphatase [Gemmatimonadaceae bacterium]
MTGLAAVLAAFREATGCAAAVWEAVDGPLTLVAGDVPLPAPDTALPAAPFHAELPGGVAVVPFGGARRGWVAVQGGGSAGTAERWGRFLAPLCAQWRRREDLEGRTARELAERYVEIDLLHTAAEILGRTVKVDETAQLILRAICEAVGARIGVVLSHDAASDRLSSLAAVGVARDDVPVLNAADLFSPAARAFRDRSAVHVGPDDPVSDTEAALRDGAMLLVPVVWAGGGQGQPLGVVALSARRGGQAFTPAETSLVAAVAAQVGIAMQNAALVRDSTDRREFAREMQLAHDLQMKLLPKPQVVAPHASAAARVVPAESVGGDFYHLFRLEAGRTGVMIGDVSGHGYRAAMIMALALSAAAIHAQQGSDPGAVLGALGESLADELEQTEMFLTACYTVLDPAAGQLHWANAGHPHAFRLDAAGSAHRLDATAAPLGMAMAAPPAAHSRWVPTAPDGAAGDLLVLFTDGLPDARNRKGQKFGEQKLLALIAKHRADPPAMIVDRVFDAVRRHAGDAAGTDDLTLVVVRT